MRARPKTLSNPFYHTEHGIKYQTTTTKTTQSNGLPAYAMQTKHPSGLLVFLQQQQQNEQKMELLFETYIETFYWVATDTHTRTIARIFNEEKQDICSLLRNGLAVRMNVKIEDEKKEEWIEWKYNALHMRTQRQPFSFMLLLCHMFSSAFVRKLRAQHMNAIRKVVECNFDNIVVNARLFSLFSGPLQTHNETIAAAVAIVIY